MTEFNEIDEIDDEIDRDMGWLNGKGSKKGKKKSGPGLKTRLKNAWWRARPMWQPFATALYYIRRVVFFPIVTPLGYTKHFNANGDMLVVKRSWLWRLMDGLLTRLLLTPIILGIFLIGIVYSTTHPARVVATTTPSSVGLYFKRVNIFTMDNERLSGLYVPPLTADEIMFDTDETLVQKWPAAVVCHGLGAGHDQYLKLTQELHNAGFAVLLLDMRGQGESDTSAVTYGLRERVDVLAGVKYLRELPSIDRNKVCVVGHDIGATAVIQAAALDSSITAVVADGMWPKFEDRARNIFSHACAPNGPSLYWMAPLYTLAFEISLRDRISQLDPQAIVTSIHTQPILFVARSGPNYVSVQDVAALAASVEAKHDVILADEKADPKKPSVEKQMCDFLVQTTGWKGPKARGTQQIEKLLKNRVQ